MFYNVQVYVGDKFHNPSEATIRNFQYSSDQGAAILVTGGISGPETSAELLFTNGTSMCEMPQMSLSKSGHTQSGLTACGGSGSRKCITFEAGSWSTLTSNLKEERYWHSSWINPDGDILLIGGGSNTTTEIVYQNGTSIRSFDLKYDTKEACSIELPEMFILTGGDYTKKTVSRYSTSGWMEDLPQLNEGRRHHGCGFFYNDDVQRVFLVAGGFDGSGSWISSTETLVEGDQAWNFQNPLPSERWGLRGISLHDTVIMTGGSSGGTDVLAFDAKSSDWKKIGNLETGRHKHGASLVNSADVIPFCKN